MTAYILLNDLERDPTALRLGPDSPINGLDLQPELDPCRIEDRLWETYWHGFTPFRYYAPLRQ